MDVFGILRANIRISVDYANELDRIINDGIEAEKAKIREEYERKLAEQKERYEKAAADIRNEPLENMVRRIAREEVAKEVKENLAVEEKYDPYDGRDRPRWCLEWDGQEF